MSTLSSELRAVIEGRLKVATPGEILAIASTLCAAEPVPETNGAASVREIKRFAATDEMVLDHTTGLMWTRGNVGDKPLKWAEAKSAAEAVRIGNYTDWRLPTIRELLTLVDYDRKDPAIDPVFKCDAAWYWTSTPAAASPAGYAWVVGFGDGPSGWGYQSYEYQVRAVRAGQIVGTLA